MILKEVEFKSCKRRADRSLVYQFETLREEDSEALKQGDELIGTRGVIYFAPQINEAQKNAIDEQLKNEIIEPQRTKSQILRYSILKLAKAKGVDKEIFYKEYMDKLINHVQGQI